MATLNRAVPFRRWTSLTILIFLRIWDFYYVEDSHQLFHIHTSLPKAAVAFLNGHYYKRSSIFFFPRTLRPHSFTSTTSSRLYSSRITIFWLLFWHRLTSVQQAFQNRAQQYTGLFSWFSLAVAFISHLVYMISCSPINFISCSAQILENLIFLIENHIPGVNCIRHLYFCRCQWIFLYFNMIPLLGGGTYTNASSVQKRTWRKLSSSALE